LLAETILAERSGADAMSLNSPLLRRLYEDWKARRNHRIPRRADFDPATLSYILGSLSLIEVCRDPLRFRARVHGTNLAQHLGVEFTGKFLDEAQPSEYFRLVIEHLTDVVEQERPSFAWLVNEVMQPPVWENESLVLPLSRDGDSVDYLFAAVVHQRQFPLSQLTHPHNRLAPLPG
jgi:hypothetical protein